MKVAKFYDMHIHLYEFDDPSEAVGKVDAILVSVSDDVKSLYKTVELAQTYENVIPCAGYHPWNFKENGSLHDAYEVARLFYKLDLACVGEVGLDKRFVPIDTWRVQIEVFKLFVELASETDSYITIHSPNAWKEALEILVEFEARKAMFHWYTGPVDLIPLITGNRYYISINPAIRIQEKHRKVARETPLEFMVFESDGPYNYRGLKLNPGMIPESIKIVAELKKVSPTEVENIARLNSQRLLF